MSEHERTGVRDLTYSGWHRRANLRQYVSDFDAYRLGMIDIDSCEYCRFCSEPLALVEITHGPEPKRATVTANLARLAGIPAYSVAVLVLLGDVGQLRVQAISPRLGDVQTLTPAEWVAVLVRLRTDHEQTCRRAA